MAFSETILLPLNGPVPNNVISYKRVNNIPDNTKIKVYSGLTTNDLPSIQRVTDFVNYDNSFLCALENGMTVDTNVNIIAEVDPVEGKVERNSKIAPKVPEINSKIDDAENKLIQAIRDYSESFKQLITQTRSGGRRKRRRTRKNKRL